MLILLIILLVIAVAGFPAWPYSRGFGYWPSAIVTILAVLLLLHLLGVLRLHT